MAVGVRVMLSSTISDLVEERLSIQAALSPLGLFEVEGVAPGGSTLSGAGSPLTRTADLAANCDAYLLVLGPRYGFETSLGKSATELEFDAAYRDDPTKVLVMQKAGVTPEARQEVFISRVLDYHKGYLVSRFLSPTEAGEVAAESLTRWIRERAAVGRRLDYFDHFIRVASQRFPFPGSKATYAVTDEHVEIDYAVLGTKYSVHFDKAELNADFWGCVTILEHRFEAWRGDNFGRRASH